MPPRVILQRAELTGLKTTIKDWTNKEWHGLSTGLQGGPQRQDLMIRSNLQYYPSVSHLLVWSSFSTGETLVAL